MSNAGKLISPKMSVIGVGGAGGNALNNMIRSGLEGVDFISANTDLQALELSLTENRLRLGMELTKGLGAGSLPEVGREAAEESINQIAEMIDGAHLLFITAGMGGGTGTGAAPVIARVAREHKVLTVAVVTTPFVFEGAHRTMIAKRGLEELRRYVDTYIVISNQNLFKIADENTTFAEAFKMADDVLYSGVAGFTDLITKPGIINCDFADIRSIVSQMGRAMMGTGEASGENRAVRAAEMAIYNPLLDNLSLKDAKGILINITGGHDITLFELNAAVNCIRDQADENVNIIFGSTFEQEMEGIMKVSIVATGIHESKHVANDKVVTKKSRKERESEKVSAGYMENVVETDNRDVPAYLRRMKKKGL
ncbi:MAG: cell division protein FtsZ [Candidatus Xenolissoclinum pacificiensis L6]|uniref:Cell division protein FtsZ n=1 Tax=Candidatus Xenolissoclinum pacificiensis L6 TaxID=1401685 RepID=W2UYR1_9RICK|nr:MAG: cell division protein FtsZ [Candidatus Xenolissoclinum pacificiensis L6]